MSTNLEGFNLAYQVPLLQTWRNFPMDETNLELTLNKLYVDVANAVNWREISLYDVYPIFNGKQWYPTATVSPTNALYSSPRRMNFRQVFTFTTIAAGATLTIVHNIAPLAQVTMLYGNVITANPDFRPVPYVDVTAVTNQINIYNDDTNIYINNGSTAPNITSGFCVIEYLQS